MEIAHQLTFIADRRRGKRGADESRGDQEGNNCLLLLKGCYFYGRQTLSPCSLPLAPSSPPHLPVDAFAPLTLCASVAMPEAELLGSLAVESEENVEVALGEGKRELQL